MAYWQGGNGPATTGLNPPPPDLTGIARTWTDVQTAAQIQNGRDALPPLGEVLGADGEWSVVHYLRRLQGLQ